RGRPVVRRAARSGTARGPARDRRGLPPLGARALRAHRRDHRLAPRGGPPLGARARLSLTTLIQHDPSGRAGNMPSTLSPAEAWQRLVDGNERFVQGIAEHPGQDAARRAAVGYDQQPFAVMFGCSDSRVAAEIVFDQGIGDMFVVRTAGHVLDTPVIGSIEYGIEILSTPLVVILGHDHCGAVEAAMDALRTGNLPSGFVRAIVDRVIPSIVSVDGNSSASAAPELEKFGHEHVR